MFYDYTYLGMAIHPFYYR